MSEEIVKGGQVTPEPQKPPVNWRVLLVGSGVILLGFFMIGIGIATGDLVLDLLGIGLGTGAAVAAGAAA